MQHLQMEETAVNIANHYSIIRDRSGDLYVGIDMVKIIQMVWEVLDKERAKATPN